MSPSVYAPPPAQVPATTAAAASEDGQQEQAAAIVVKDLALTYPGVDGQPPPGARPLIQDFSLSLKKGERCLLIGANGAGKTTILKILGGKHHVDPSMVRVLGRSAFHDTGLEASGDLTYLGGDWRRDVAFAGFDVPLQMDVPAKKLLFGVQGVDTARRDRLIKVLDIDLEWRMHKVSDGQRRRVQIAMGLLRPFKVLLLDEITVDLDVVGRADLMNFLKAECDERGATVVYATHIFDGLETWPTHLAYVARGRLQFFKRTQEIEELKTNTLMRCIEKWLRVEVDAERKKRKERVAQGLSPYEDDIAADGTRVTGGHAAMNLNNGWGGGRLNPTVKLDEAGLQLFGLSSNTVLRT